MWLVLLLVLFSVGAVVVVFCFSKLEPYSLCVGVEHIMILQYFSVL